MAERGKLLWLEGQSEDTTMMKSGQNSSLLDANLEADQRWWRQSKAHSGWKTNTGDPGQQGCSYWQVNVGPKDLLS